MSALRLYNTLTRAVEPMVPKTPGEARVYCCGPTTYDVAHVGHARAALAPDILVRFLRSQGLKVKYVRNITDVDDKILARAKERGVEPMSLSAEMAVLYQDDMRQIGCLPPDVEPKVSESIADIIQLVEKLVALGAAYAVTLPNGTQDVYFRVREFPGYGKLSGRQIDDMRVGARVEANDIKQDPIDFALWKGCDGDAWGWPSPWGKGRPGWHIECSAMSARHLGHGFDVHAGGMDLIFPHHENEIAQSEAAHPGQGNFVSTWIHNGFVNVDKEKMAKSLGNFVTVRQVFDRNDPEALRYFLLTVQYRGPISFDTTTLEGGRVVFPGVLDAEKRVDYLYTTLQRLAAVAPGPEETTGGPPPKELKLQVTVAVEAQQKLREALADDLNTPVALGVIAEVAKAANDVVDLVQKRRKDEKFVKDARGVAGRLEVALRSALSLLGLCQTPEGVYAERTKARRLRVRGMDASAVNAKIQERADARNAKDFARSDAVRDELLGWGIEVLDGPEGTVWRISP